jgi:DNA primase large subunit
VILSIRKKKEASEAHIKNETGKRRENRGSCAKKVNSEWFPLCSALK